jgi:hypothetical protein
MLRSDSQVQKLDHPVWIGVEQLVGMPIRVEPELTAIWSLRGG